MKKVFHKSFRVHQETIDSFIENFNVTGVGFGDGDRNTIKLFELDGHTINIKSFKVPNIFNQIAYRFLRKSKAQRSFEYANILLDSGIGTPQPIAYYEFSTALLFKKSFYVSHHLECNLT